MKAADPQPAGTVRSESVRAAAQEHASKHRRLIRSTRDGKWLSAAMLPFFLLRPPSGFGVIETTGRKTGKVRRKCVRVIRRGEVAYIVQLRPPQVALRNPAALSGWLLNIRANPNVRLRMRGGRFSGVARELSDPAELAEAREAFCETVHLFDYGECDAHLRGLPTRAKVKDLHRYWFDTGVPLVVELGG
ncbi:MAG: nitroreductase family deazaflavin-dependent oxidoreductase [Actinobacteria bacterium]|nr:MAG: nitroreductase family deazaflavin-dependent oxidoreductase [Actinomycetota bacterium]